ncbi:MAG: TonB-dependent receptor [Acidimicrobiia bacterium]|nr:TonB-dependent receptor [Acidimicrobiia bacterium]
MPSLLTAQSPSPAAPKLEPVHSSITVVEKVSTEAPASVAILPSRELSQIPGVNLDDRLRMVPGFSLFRRSSSIAAHPTTQGISLRGLGSTGASRTLVLWDGVPWNDPFGGWVYWTRIAPEQIDRVEVSRGASTSIFGDRAMGGAIALFSRQPENGRFHASYEAGNRGTHSAGAGYSHIWSTSGPKIALSGQGRAFSTDGYFIVPKANRGAVDTQAGVRFTAADTRLDLLGSRDRLFLKFDLLAEERANGTALQRNSTSLGNIAAHYYRDINRDGLSVTAWHGRQEFRSSFTTIAANRATERVTSNQSVPAEAFGAAGFWKHAGPGWNSMLGADMQRVEGTSIDSLVPTGKRIGGGTQFQRGYFAQFNLKSGPAQFFLGGRHHFTGQDRQFFSPSAGLAAGRGRWRARSSLYRSFRAPTLNELHREFRAGNAATLPNPLLKPEGVFGAEAGFDVSGEATRASFTFFRSSMSNIITNVTLSTSPNQIIRQRQNAASALARGLEADLRHRWRNWQAELGYLYVESRFSNRLRIPQVPKHQGSAQFTYSRKDTLASFGVRSAGLQFEDDLNRFLLPGFATAHISLQQRLHKGLSAVCVFENLFNREYWVGFSVIPAIGPPRLYRIGLRWDGRLF